MSVLKFSDVLEGWVTFNFGHKCTTNESNANHLKSILFISLMMSLDKLESLDFFY